MNRVLHVIESLDPGGAERVVLEYAANHDRARVSPEVCCVVRRGALADILRGVGVPVHFLARRTKVDLRATLSLALLVRRGRFDVVHNHNFAAVAVGVPAAILGGARAVVRTEHNVLPRGHPHRLVYSWAAALREDAQIAVSDGVRASHVGAHRIPGARFVTIRNGIGDARLAEAADRSAARRSLGASPEEVVCLTVASLTEQKNHENLLAAAALVPRELPVRFFIVGDGPLRERIEQRVQELGLGGRVRLLGQRLDVPLLLSGADLFVLSSDWEGLPITVLESMAAGVPCVSTRVGGVPETVEDGKSGLIVPPRDPRALSDAVVRLARDAPLRGRLAKAARAAYERGFTGEQMTRQTEALYELALAGRADAASSRIKILFVIGQLGYGGAERQLYELASMLPKSRFEAMVCVLGGPGPLLAELQAAGIRVTCLGKRRGLWSDATMALVRMIRRERPAIVHSYLFSANWRSLLAARGMRVPIVISSVRNVDIHPRWYPRVIERMLSYLTDVVIANAEAVKDYVARDHWTPAHRIHVIHNGVSTARFASSAPAAPTHSAETARESARAAGARGPTVAVLASLTPKKDHFTFLDAAALVGQRMPNARFHIVGDGPLRGAILARVRELGLEGRVRLEGETDDIPGMLAGVDVSVLTSLKEGCSNAVLESMVAGKPVVATDVGGNRELIVDGVTGYLAPAGDARAVADRVLTLLSNPALAARMGTAARERATAEFSVEHMVAKTTALYERFLNERLPGLVAWVDACAARDGGPR